MLYYPILFVLWFLRGLQFVQFGFDRLEHKQYKPKNIQQMILIAITAPATIIHNSTLNTICAGSDPESSLSIISFSVVVGESNCCPMSMTFVIV